MIYPFDENIGFHVVKIASKSIKRSGGGKFDTELSGIVLKAYHCQNDEVNWPLNRMLLKTIRGKCKVQEPHIPWGLATTTNEGTNVIARNNNALKKCIIHTN